MREKPSTEFEHQVERIHQLLEGEPSRVTWNDKIPDPDNPDQPRQIDVTIERDGTILHVECRIHRTPQDVQWIEELIGRRLSLRADAMIAVSSSGFTEGAIRKAKKFDIHLRTLQSLTEDEIRLWGNMARPTLVFYEFTDAVFCFTMGTRYLATPVNITSEDGTQINWRGVFEPVISHADSDQELDSNAKGFNAEIFAPLLVNGVRPLKMELSGTIRRISRPMSLDAALAYAEAGDAGEDVARVQRHEGGVVEILQSNDDVAFVSDSANVVVPPNCFLSNVWMDFGRGVNVQWVKVINVLGALKSDVKIGFSFKYVPQ